MYIQGVENVYDASNGMKMLHTVTFGMLTKWNNQYITLNSAGTDMLFKFI